MANENSNPLPPEIQKMLSEQLRDVHLPDAVSWWPLAWGWWVLIILFMLSVGAALFLIVQKYKKNRYRKLATAELNNVFKTWQNDQQTQIYLHRANDILKRVVLQSEQSSLMTTLSGQTWVEQLNVWAKKPLTQNSQNALAFDCYKESPSSDIKALHTDLVSWLKFHDFSKQTKAQQTNENNLGGPHA